MADESVKAQLLTNSKQVGEILRRRRKARRIPQRELASKLGISQSRLSTLEGDPTALTLERLLVLAKLLGLELVLRAKADPAESKAEW